MARIGPYTLMSHTKMSIVFGRGRSIACVAGGMRERASGGGAVIFLAGKAREELRAAKPRVKFPPATFRMVFACPPLLSPLMNQLNKPIRQRSVT